VSEEQRTASALVGAVLDARYRIEGLLGEGGMGAVYSATDLRLDKLVAIKVMARELSANPDALARFHREARVTSALGHPHIVQVLDFSTTPTGEPFLAMEFLEGEDLDHRLRRDRRLDLGRVVHIVRQVASALAATHAKAIVHRDLKPGNIYLLEAAGETDFVKVLDFGISKVRSSSTKLTRTASVMGTPNYMSPEQAKGKVEDIDDRTDQWALACIAWECLAGEGPFVGENVCRMGTGDCTSGTCVTLNPDVLVSGSEWGVCQISCDLVKSARCKSSQACIFANGSTDCLQSGTTKENGACSSFYDCATGLACVGSGVCIHYCQVNAPSCSNGNCFPFYSHPKIGGIEYGACYSPCDPTNPSAACPTG
jgi:serine/threonine protein kinase